MTDPRRYSIMTIVGAILYTVTLVAIVVLTIAHERVDQIMVLAGPVVAALLVSGQIGHRSDQQDAALAQITRQTNGVLDSRIRDGVRQALADHDAEKAASQ